MSATFIVDCSLAATWLFKEEATPHTTRLLHRLDAETALVPALWFLELSNVLAVAERKGRITSAESTNFVVELSKLDFEIYTEATERAFDHLLPLCRTYGLTSYDSVYLDLAVRRHIPLATLDEPLRKAAKKLKVKLLGK